MCVVSTEKYSMQMFYPDEGYYGYLSYNSLGLEIPVIVSGGRGGEAEHS